MIELINKIVEQRLEEYTRPKPSERYFVPPVLTNEKIETLVNPVIEPELRPKVADDPDLPPELLAKAEALTAKKLPTRGHTAGCKHINKMIAKQMIALSKRGVDTYAIAKLFDVRRQVVVRCLRGITFRDLPR